MVLLIVVCVLVTVLSFVLFTPLVLEIDSTRNLYEMRLTGLAKVSLVFEESSVFVQYNALWWKKALNPFRTGIPHNSAENNEPVKRSKTKPSFRRVFIKIKAVLASFHIKVFYVDIDTGDFLLNAWLYPLVWLASGREKHIRINYAGNMVVKVKVVNNIARLLWTILT